MYFTFCLVLSMQRSGRPEKKPPPCAPQPNHPNPCRQCPKNGPLLPCQMFQVWTLYEPTFQGWCIKAAWKKIGAPSGSLFPFYTALAFRLNLTKDSWVCALLSILFYWSLPSASPKVTPPWVWPIQTQFIELSPNQLCFQEIGTYIFILAWQSWALMVQFPKNHYFNGICNESHNKRHNESHNELTYLLPSGKTGNRSIPCDQQNYAPPIPTVTDLYNGQTNQSINWGTPLLIVIRHAWTNKH